jgi:hypothetical protein
MTRKAEVAQHRCRNCGKIGSRSATSWLAAKSSQAYHEIPRNPLVYHEILLEFATVCYVLLWSARTFGFHPKPRNLRTLEPFSRQVAVPFRDQAVIAPCAMVAAPLAELGRDRHGDQPALAGLGCPGVMTPATVGFQRFFPFFDSVLRIEENASKPRQTRHFLMFSG